MTSISPLATIPWSHLKEGKVLGKGGYGIVHLGEWNGQPVAIKKLFLETLSDHMSREFKKEAEVLWRCGESPYIVKLLGVCIEPKQCALVLEYMTKGSLYDVLSNKEVELPWQPLRFRIAWDIGKGIAYLHDWEMIHRDIKSPNVLLDANCNAKLSDFGLIKVRFASESKLQSIIPQGQLVGTLCWLAPESLTVNPVYSKASDVYAYAMVLFEIASRSLPYAGARVNIEEHVKNGERPLIPDVTPTGFTKLIEQGWHQKPEERPGIHYFLRRLEASGFIPLAAPSIVPRGAQATPSISSFRAAQARPQASPPTMSRPNIRSLPAVPACEALRALIVKLVDHGEMGSYPALSSSLSAYLDTLFEISGTQSLNGQNLKIYELAKIMISSDNKISPAIAARLEKALAPQSPPASTIKPASPIPTPISFPAVVKAPVLSPTITTFGEEQWKWKHLPADKIADEIKALPSLTSLDLSGCNEITGDELAEALMVLPRLTSLNLEGCRQITEEKLAEALMKLPNLTNLNLNYCRQITGENLAKALMKLPNLTSLKLTGCNEITGDKLAEAIMKLPNLISLSLHYCNKITGDKLAEALMKLPKLTELNLWGCNQITEEKLAEALMALPMLTSLDLTLCTQITEKMLAEALLRLPNLTELNLGLCQQITGEKLAEALIKMPKLTSLYLAWCQQITEEKLAQALMKLPNLTSLNLACCKQIREKNLVEALMKLPKKLPNLTSLNLAGCDQITGEKLAQALVKLPNLTRLYLTGCKITSEMLAKLRADFPNVVIEK